MDGYHTVEQSMVLHFDAIIPSPQISMILVTSK